MPTDIQAPSIAYLPLMPMLVVFGAAVVGVLVEAFLGPKHRRHVQLGVGVGGLLIALGFVISLAYDNTSRLVVESAIAIDGPTLFLQGTLCVLGIGSLLLLTESRVDASGGSIVSCWMRGSSAFGPGAPCAIHSTIVFQSGESTLNFSPPLCGTAFVGFSKSSDRAGSAGVILLPKAPRVSVR